MSAVGKWLGQYVGNWFGSQEPSDTTYADSGLVVGGVGTATLHAEVNQPAIYQPGICTNVTSLPGPTSYRPAKKRKKLFKSQWWKQKHIVVDGIEVEPLKPFETFDAVPPAPTIPPAMLMRTRASKARLHRTAAPAIRPAALMRSKPTFLPLIRS